ncbi:MAG: fibronectin type III domain-containing protein [Bacteroidota bacterium]
MTPADLERIPKYDRPDLAVLQNFEMTRDPASNSVPTARAMSAFAQVKRDIASARAIPGVSWTERGPDNIGGRTRAVMFDPNDPSGQKVWAGGVGGGLWTNSNITSASTVWQNIDDFWANIAITTITYDPTNTQTFYVGTGEGFFNADAIRGAGIWKSTNGGVSWTQLPSTNVPNFYYVQKVAVTPTGTLLAATSAGLFRSVDGGASWSSLFSGPFSDIEVASNGDVYASAGIFSPGSVRKSTTDGVSWTTVTPASGGERIELAIAPSDPNTVYAVASVNSSIAWLRKTTNGGLSWSTLPIPAYTEQSCSLSSSNDFARGQSWYNLIMSVSPTNPNVVLVGGIDIYRSSNGGSNWNLVSYWTGACDTYVHADQHAMQFSPVNPNVAIFGNDGGVFYSSNVGVSANPSFVARNNGYNVTQFYAADQVNASGSNIMLAGAQDNGSLRYTAPGVNSTNEVTGGDGAFCHIDQQNGNYQFTSYVYNSYYRSTNGGASFSPVLQNQTYGRFINPTDYDDDAKILYCGANENQYIIVDNLTGSPGAFLRNASLGGNQVSAVKVSPYTANRIFLGTGTAGSSGGSAVFRVDNAQTTSPSVTQISTSALPGNGYISSIALGASDAEILVTYSNYGLASVWETSNGGTTWQNKEGNLPDIPVRWALYNPANTNEVLLATEVGVWSTDNIGAGSPNWGPTSLGLANVRCDMLQYRESDGQVIVATHGRGAYTGTPFSGTTPDTEAPSTPTNLAASNVGPTSFDVSWTASTDNIGVTGYSVYINGALAGSTASNSYSFSGLSPASSYTVAVEANDAAGNTSGQATLGVTTGTATVACGSTVTSFPYAQGFESGAGWSQGTGDDGDWINFSGSTPSGSTGPSSAAEGSSYMYLEASTNGTPGQIGPNATAILVSPCFDLSSSPTAEFSFQYHMLGSAMGSLALQATTDDLTFTTLWTLSGDQGNSWGSASVDLSAYLGASVKLRIVGTTGGGWQSDIAIDNLQLTTGTAGDTQPPTSPTGLTAANISTASFDVSWGASSDNVGVDGYNVYLEGNFQGSTTSTSYSFSDLFAGTAYGVAVEAFDAAGNTSGQVSITVTTEANTGGSEVILSSFFESGWDGWTDGGGDCYRYNGGFSWEGNYSIRIRDNSGSRSAMTYSSLDISPYDRVDIEFYFYPNSMENGEDFWVRYNDGSGWQTIATYVSGQDFSNGTFYVATVSLDRSSFNLVSNAQFRIQCDASANGDQVYIDAVTITGVTNGQSNVLNGVASVGSTQGAQMAAVTESTRQFATEDLFVYPNPTAKTVFFGNLPEFATIEVVNLSGQVLMKHAAVSELDVSELKTGLYFIRISDDEEQQVFKLMKE